MNRRDFITATPSVVTASAGVWALYPEQTQAKGKQTTKILTIWARTELEGLEKLKSLMEKWNQIGERLFWPDGTKDVRTEDASKDGVILDSKVAPDSKYGDLLVWKVEAAKVKIIAEVTGWESDQILPAFPRRWENKE